MGILVDRDKCTGCGICIEICPMDAIRLDEDGIPHLRYDECWYCGACEEECPTEAITLELPYPIR